MAEHSVLEHDRGALSRVQVRRPLDLSAQRQRPLPQPLEESLEQSLQVEEVGGPRLLGPVARANEAREQDAEATFLDGKPGSGVEDASHFEERDVPTPLPLIGVQRLEQPRHDEGGAQHGLGVGQGVLEGHHLLPRRRPGGTRRRLPHECVGDRLREAGRHEGGPHRSLLGLTGAEAAPSVRGRDRRRDLVEAEVPAHLLDEVGLAAHVTAPARDLDGDPLAFVPLPHPGPHPEAEAGKDRLRLRRGHVDAQHRPGARGAQEKRALRAGDDHTVHRSRSGGARADLLEQVGDPGQGDHRGLGVGPPLETVRGLGVHAQGPSGAPDREGLPVRGLQGHHARLLRDLARGAAHDPGQGQGLLGPGHHAVAEGERPRHAVQGLQLLPLSSPADEEPALGDPRQVEGVGGMAHVVDRPHPDRLQAVPDPRGGRSRTHVEDPGREPRAQVGGLDGNLQGLRCRSSLLGEAQGRRPQGEAVEHRDLPGEAVDVHAVHAVGGDVDVEHGVLAVALAAVQGEARQGQVVAQSARLHRDLDELAQPGDGESHRETSGRLPTRSRPPARGRAPPRPARGGVNPLPVRLRAFIRGIAPGSAGRFRRRAGCRPPRGASW